MRQVVDMTNIANRVIFKMITKVAIILLCGMTSLTAMDSNERREFMRNGRQHAAGMSPEQRRAFMRDGRRVSQEHARNSRSSSASGSDSESNIEELLELARKMSVKDKKTVVKEEQTYIKYNVKINQNLNNSTGNINVGKNNSNTNF
jgi:phage baseplate assembly protein gpV